MLMLSSVMLMMMTSRRMARSRRLDKAQDVYKQSVLSRVLSRSLCDDALSTLLGVDQLLLLQVHPLPDEVLLLHVHPLSRLLHLLPLPGLV